VLDIPNMLSGFKTPTIADPSLSEFTCKDYLIDRNASNFEYRRNQKCLELYEVEPLK